MDARRDRLSSSSRSVLPRRTPLFPRSPLTPKFFPLLKSPLSQRSLPSPKLLLNPKLLPSLRPSPPLKSKTPPNGPNPYSSLLPKPLLSLPVLTYLIINISNLLTDLIGRGMADISHFNKQQAGYFPFRVNSGKNDWALQGYSNRFLSLTKQRLQFS